MDGGVLKFAHAMDLKLAANMHKGGWEGSSPEWLLKRLRQEVKELEQAITKKQSAKRVLEEAADVANFAMMIADVIWDARADPSVTTS